MSAERLLQPSIISSRVIPFSSPIHVPFKISRESLPLAQVILVEVTNQDGRTGLGECAPFPSLTHDTTASAQKTADDLLTNIQGLTAEKALVTLRSLKAEAIRQSITGFVGVEGAVWDLYAREKNQPLAHIWGGGKQSTLESDITLPIMEPGAISGFWDIYQSFAFKTIKIKVSGRIEEDLDMIRALQRIVPAQTQYILDGNQGFTVSDAKTLVDRLRAWDIRPLFFEQALPEADLRGLVSLSETLPIPVCVDETVRSVEDLQTLIDAGIRPIVNIKLMKSGIEESLRIIALAKENDCELMIGGMLESEVAMGLSLQMACGTGAIRYADLDTPFFFKEKVCRDSPWHRGNAVLHLPKGSGHGLTL